MIDLFMNPRGALFVAALVRRATRSDIKVSDCMECIRRPRRSNVLWRMEGPMKPESNAPWRTEDLPKPESNAPWRMESMPTPEE